MALTDGEQTPGQRKERPPFDKNSTFLETILIVLFNVLLETDDEL